MLSVTVQKLIKQARFANGSLGDGVTMSADEVSDDMLALNIMLAEWSASGFGVYYDKQEYFTLTAGQSSYTWGTGGNFNSSRPTELRDQTFLRINNVDYPVSMIGQEEYASISTKEIVESWPNKIYFDSTYPLATVSLYPVPDQNYVMYVTSAKTIDTLTSFTEIINLPQEYASAIKWNLSIELAPNYSVPVTPVMMTRAKRSLNVVKSLNADQRLEQARLKISEIKPEVYLKNINDGA